MPHRVRVKVLAIPRSAPQQGKGRHRGDVQAKDAALDKFARRPLDEPFPSRILGAHHERVGEAGIIVSRAVLIAVAIVAKAGARF